MKPSCSLVVGCIKIADKAVATTLSATSFVHFAFSYSINHTRQVKGK
ncbi:hypothetical protein wTpre_1144 [Wolbachia endosymbiont of Trichogramma pretiosum]|nr:hypothetical protein wTpre_1144 [Wolbachia endosymbiont of Trichogramma pretiosum]